MAQTKFTVSISITVSHADGAKISRRAIAERIKERLEIDPDGQPADFDFDKVVVRDVDKP